VMGKPAGAEIAIKSLPQGGPAGSVRSVAMLGGGSVKFNQNAAGLTVTVQDSAERREAFALKIVGLKTNPDLNTESGNPDCGCGQQK
jgi:hypothetical protein